MSNQPSTPEKPLIVVTGSSGLIGQRLTEALADDYRVAALDVQEPETERDNVHWYRCDLTEDNSVSEALRSIKHDLGEQIASVVHLAAYYDFSGEPSPLYDELTVKGTRRVLRGLQQFQVQQFVFSSSLLVMKSSENGQPVTAFSPLDAEWDYPQSKLAAESVIAENRGSIPAVILRLAGVYDEDGHSIPLAQQIARIYERQMESYFFPGDKTHGQSFIHLDDTVNCLLKCIERRDDLPEQEVFTIGEEDVMSYEDLQEAIGRLIHGREWPTIRIPKTVAKTGAWVKDKLASSEEDAPFIKPWMIDLADQNYPVNIRRACEQLHWKPNNKLAETLPAMIDRLLQDPHRWYEINGLPLPKKLAKEQAKS